MVACKPGVRLVLPSVRWSLLRAEHCSAAADTASGSASASEEPISEELLQPSQQQQQQEPAAPQLCSQPGKGVLLVSHPSLGGWFKRAVVLLCQHDPQLGAYGWGGGGLALGAALPHLAGWLGQVHEMHQGAHAHASCRVLAGRLGLPWLGHPPRPHAPPFLLRAGSA